MPGGPGHRARAILMNNGDDAHHPGMPLLTPGTPVAGHRPVDAGSDPTLVAVQHMFCPLDMQGVPMAAQI